MTFSMAGPISALPQNLLGAVVSESYLEGNARDVDSLSFRRNTYRLETEAQGGLRGARLGCDVYLCSDRPRRE